MLRVKMADLSDALDGVKKDFMSLLVRANLDKAQGEEATSDRAMVDQVLTFLVGATRPPRRACLGWVPRVKD